MSLTERQKLILALVIRDHIESAQPVGSPSASRTRLRQISSMGSDSSSRRWISAAPVRMFEPAIC